MEMEIGPPEEIVAAAAPGKRKGQIPLLASIYRSLAEHTKHEGYPKSSLRRTPTSPPAECRVTRRRRPEPSAPAAAERAGSSSALVNIVP
ncbi:hypothetical protein AB0K16_57375 [Nonomuraea jabiensis]|uniref:hypothetical protein n=1 Tax=Nonomuraea jabiensis TaxID=882448 RepID=UPI0034291A1D